MNKFTALNYPKCMKTPAPWFIRGKNILLDKVVEMANNQKPATAIFLNFSKENVMYSTLNKDQKFVCVAICTNEEQYEKVTRVWNRYGEMFDVVIPFYNREEDVILPKIKEAVAKKYGIEPSENDRWGMEELRVKIKI